MSVTSNKLLRSRIELEKSSNRSITSKEEKKSQRAKNVWIKVLKSPPCGSYLKFYSSSPTILLMLTLSNRVVQILDEKGWNLVSVVGRMHFGISQELLPPLSEFWQLEYPVFDDKVFGWSWDVKSVALAGALLHLKHFLYHVLRSPVHVEQKVGGFERLR